MKLAAALAIAGSDSSGGAGIQADIKTMMANGVFAMSAVTALTAQNTTGVRSVMEATPDFLADEIDMVFEDIRPDAVKIGMVSSVPLIRTIAERLISHRAENIVLDPVMVATSGARLIEKDATDALCRELFPLSTLITPNIPELSLISGTTLTGDDADTVIEAARAVSERWGVAVLAKGGHMAEGADDFLVTGESVERFAGERIATKNTHGTGCTLSSAIAANMAKGMTLRDAVGRAKDFVTGALKADLTLGAGAGPLHHGFLLRSEYID